MTEESAEAGRQASVSVIHYCSMETPPQHVLTALPVRGLHFVELQSG